jgi:hypothetical protein
MPAVNQIPLNVKIIVMTLGLSKETVLLSGIKTIFRTSSFTLFQL